MPDSRRQAQVPLLERRDLPPRDRDRIGRAVSEFLGVGLAATAAIGLLALWHLVRRGRLIRRRLGNPKVVRLPDVGPGPADRPPPPA